MSRSKLLCAAFILTLLSPFSAYATVWQSATVDVDGDYANESVDYVVGEIGEYSIAYSYYPPDFLAAFNVPRVHVGIFGLEEIVSLDGVRILDTGIPTLNGSLIYLNTLYQSKNTSSSEGYTITTWIQDSLKLVRKVDVTTDRAFVDYKLYCNNDVVGSTAFIIPWNRGRTSIASATAYVDTMWNCYKTNYADGYAAASPSGYRLQLAYSFDDYLQKNSGDFILGYDDGSPAIYGMGFLPLPDTISVVNYGACSNAANITWALKKDLSAPVTASVRIEPEHINVSASGLITGFVYLSAPYGFDDIDAGTVACSGAKAVIKERGNEGCVLFKFDRKDLINLPDGLNALTIKGQLYNSLSFEGTDTVEISHSGTGRDGGRKGTYPVLKPNPFTNKISFEIPMEAGSSAEMPVIKIYNLTGQVVRTLTNQEKESKVFTATWDGRDGNGLKVAAGAYVYRLVAGGRSYSGRFLYLR